ncbi:MAG: Bax inhibitor-1/YccA family protein, partial [Parasporobacterium sp.]|nr:Bax inhibitor-1/YccA family protein [Parasporobacterium sp.]
MANTAVQQPEKKGFSLTLANPVIRKLEKNGEFGSDRTATYGGIVGKTVFFLIVTVIGVLLCFILHNILTGNGAANLIHVEDTKNGIYDLTLSVGEAVIAGVALLVSLITPFLAWFIRPTIPVTGTLYSLAQGLLIGYITVALVPEYRFISLLAMIITIALVAVMLFIYAKKIITVTARFRGIITGIFAGIVLSGIVYFLLNLIPAVRNSTLFSGINTAMQNPALSIIIGIVFVILASLFMLADFDTIQRCVENQVDKKYEWMAAWGLAY